ncbi:hypothetical protein D2Q93_09670 [Alicyclobacillaceae bacterium I2511]|nr:hypothetical protein D2Q93_09670 [Alicyclobacillaceae bacterium I2511]
MQPTVARSTFYVEFFISFIMILIGLVLVIKTSNLTQFIGVLLMFIPLLVAGGLELREKHQA